MGTLQLTLAMLSTVNLGACSADAYEEKLQKQIHNPPSLFHDKEFAPSTHDGTSHSRSVRMLLSH